jgi:hypothetical protein
MLRLDAAGERQSPSQLGRLYPLKQGPAFWHNARAHACDLRTGTHVTAAECPHERTAQRVTHHSSARCALLSLQYVHGRVQRWRLGGVRH